MKDGGHYTACCRRIYAISLACYTPRERASIYMMYKIGAPQSGCIGTWPPTWPRHRTCFDMSHDIIHHVFCLLACSIRTVGIKRRSCWMCGCLLCCACPMSSGKVSLVDWSLASRRGTRHWICFDVFRRKLLCCITICDMSRQTIGRRYMYPDTTA
jgi:hypothetical protein